MNIKSQALHYSLDGMSFKGMVSFNAHIKHNQPAVLIAPTWRGCDALAQQQAYKIAELGYIGIAIDMYGNGQIGNNADECAALMQPLIEDRTKLQQHIMHALTTVRDLQNVDSEKIAAIGFCFGGLCVLDLARSGANIKGVVSIHGLLTQPKLSKRSKITAINTKVLILHGSNDPLAPLEDLITLSKELTSANADWEINLYSNTAHAFTNPEAKLPEQGLLFNQYAHDRTWNSIHHFLKKLFE